MGSITIGVDIGQRVDPTAIAVVEAATQITAGRVETVHTVRYLERLPLGTPYPEVAQVIAGLVREVRKRGAVRIYVDGTGVGLPVTDLLKQAGVPVVTCFFTYGDRRIVKDAHEVSIGKAWLVSRLVTLLQTGRLKAPRTPEAEALSRELLDFEIRVDENANDKYGAFRVGTHDDLVTALGLATQVDAGRPFSSAVGGMRSFGGSPVTQIDEQRALLYGRNEYRPR